MPEKGNKASMATEVSGSAPTHIERPAEGDGVTLLGQRLGPYQLVRHIGQGGMGVVYEALDTRLGRAVALKLLHAARWAGDPISKRRLMREAQAASALDHPNICTLHDFLIRK